MHAHNYAVHVYEWMVLPAGRDKVRTKGEFESLHSTWLVGKFSVQFRTRVPCLSEGYPYREVSTMCMWGKETVCISIGYVGHKLKSFEGHFSNVRRYVLFSGGPPHGELVKQHNRTKNGGMQSILKKETTTIPINAHPPLSWNLSLVLRLPVVRLFSVS